ncbi:polyketide synthase [Penicillium brevicompactum]|uniref:Polyketide synthase n=1 Tax=Penicillium brevicompactum TaxID=5074 RepID=A0A9W9QMH4_PENBR|nr:polyketide synthase [Penicillium brevicompactum]
MPDLYGDLIMPIAVVGTGGRFPGDASNPDRLWELLLNARSTLSETPKDRFNVDGFYHPQAERAGTQNFREGHFMNRPIDAFDAPFFSITPAEAEAMDPQQRMCLEVAYEALENAGIQIDQVSASNTSCYVGCFNHDYMNLMNRDPENIPFYNATGTEASCLSNRVSWFFNLAGPSMTVDTACSSSLIALHLASQSIRTGESDTSLIGGVNIMSSMEMNMQLSNLQMISPDGKSKTFDEKANGYGRGEGTCFVVIKSLEKALKDNDVIRAVIRNTGSNQDGNTPGLTLPSRTMQESLIRKVYHEAGLRMDDTGYFEAHGTGTAAGDSTETRAIGETIGKSRPADQPLWLGSVKSNIGHLEGGSGLAALIKSIYVLEQGLIPPQIWLEKVNPRILLQQWNLAIATEVTEWPYSGPRRASVNSFGFAGANAHVILDDAASYLKSKGIRGKHNSRTGRILSNTSSRFLNSDHAGAGSEQASGIALKPFPQLLVWSAHEQAGLKRIQESWTQYLLNKSGTLSPTEQRGLLTDLSYTAAERRTRFPWRSFTVCSKLEEMINGEHEIPAPVRSSRRPRVAFVFTGQGAQHYAMGRRLMEYEPYASSMGAADTYLKSLGCSWSLLDELSRSAESSRVNPAEFSQPLCIALQVALVDLLQSLGVWPPDAVIGHSGGETAAAYAKGALTRESAWAVAYHRGRVCSMASKANLGLDGDMLAAGISEEEGLAYINQIDCGALVVACVNSPKSITLSGDVPAIVEAEKLIKADGHLAKRLGVNRAYHSSHMMAVSEIYRDLLKDIHALPETTGSPKMFSCVTGALIDNCDLGGNYWVTNLLSQVKFSQALGGLINYSNTGRVKSLKEYCYVELMLEIGPHGAMQGPVKQNLKEKGARCTSISVLDRKKDAAHSLLEAIGVLFQHGFEGNIVAANRQDTGVEPKLLVDIPPFPWNHSHRYWHESARVSDYRFRKCARKDLLGVQDNKNGGYAPLWRHFLRLPENPWMEDHQVENTIIYPAAGMVAMALEAARETSEADKVVDTYELRDVRIFAAIMISREGDGAETTIQLHTSPDSWQTFSIHSRVGRGTWSLNCSGALKTHYMTAEMPAGFVDEGAFATAAHKADYERTDRICAESLSTQDFYEKQSALGLQFGELFQNVQGICKSSNQMVYAVRTPNVASAMPHDFTHDHLIHPCTLDSLIHASLAILNDQLANEPAVPTFIQKILISGVSRPIPVLSSVHTPLALQWVSEKLK